MVLLKQKKQEVRRLIKRINHVGFAVRSIDETLRQLKAAFGAEEVERRAFPELGQTSCIVRIGASCYELMEPCGEGGVVSKFLAKRGEGFHHVSLLSDDLAADTAAVEQAGVQVVSKLPNAIFTDPRSSGGVLYEITTMET